jgi:hypothetical protein
MGVRSPQYLGGARRATSVTLQVILLQDGDKGA